MSGNRSHARNAYTRSTTVEVYEYISPGTYVVPMVEAIPAPAPPPCAYLQDYAYIPWNMSPPCSATYVVSPGGVVNYLSDLQQHMALPNADTLNTGLIYGILQSDQNEGSMHESLETSTSDQELDYNYEHIEDQSMVNEMQDLLTGGEHQLEPSVRQSHSHKMSETDEDSDYGVSPSKRARLMTSDELHEYDEKFKTLSVPFITNAEDGIETAIKSPKKRRRPKNVYRAEQGYLVEEPSEPESDEVPGTQRTETEVY